MFDQVKVNQNSIINLLKTPERENSDILSKNSNNDFFSMVMEKTGYEGDKSKADNKIDTTAMPQNNSEKIEPLKTDYNYTINDNSRRTGITDREDSSSAKEKIVSKEIKHNETKDEVNPNMKDKEVKNNSDNSIKDARVKKNSSKDPEVEAGILNQLHAETNIKNIMEMIKAAFNGNKKAEDENLQKLFSNLKTRSKKEIPGFESHSGKNESDKTRKSTFELLSLITKELKDLINKELSKSAENRKSGSKSLIFNDKELKELALNLIESIKKNKAKDLVKHETKLSSADEVKVEKKPVLSVDQQPLKKMEIPNESSFEKNGANDKNSGKENFSYNGAKIDFSAKSGLERMEHSLKTADFKETLNEIIDKAKITVRDSRNGTFTVRLNPQELGNVNVNLIMENGVITGKFFVDNEDVKSMLLSSLNDLKYQFEEAGIAVGDFSVNVNDQREKYLKQKDDESLKSLSFLNSDRDIIAASDQYNAVSAAHTGHINMVI
jgi:flagellar hook-length control protein FliK